MVIRMCECWWQPSLQEVFKYNEIILMGGGREAGTSKREIQSSFVHVLAIFATCCEYHWERSLESSSSQHHELLPQIKALDCGR